MTYEIQLFNDAGCLLDSVPFEVKSGDRVVIGVEVDGVIRNALTTAAWILALGDTIKIVERS